MQTTIDAAGRIVVPKALRDELGLKPGSTVDISRYGSGLQIVPGGRSGHLEVVDGRLVLTGEGEIDNEDVLRLLDAGRR
ncbi:MAG TPA: AbrB/MazE/SpoVT family DNA-binding domain-containing protein [Mycobacteriales bacterium]|nr:AbrB/MazE/SpoVT family DNA-binding domain-containing protein [Mycobacteriales bacterium]